MSDHSIITTTNGVLEVSPADQQTDTWEHVINANADVLDSFITLVTIDDSGLSGDVAVINDTTNTNILDIRDGFIFKSIGQDVQNGYCLSDDYSWGMFWDTGGSGGNWGVSNQFDLIDNRFSVLMAYRSTVNATDGLAGFYEDAGHGYNCNGYLTADPSNYGNYIFTPTTTVIDPVNGNIPLTIPDMSFSNGSGLTHVTLDGAGNFSGDAPNASCYAATTATTATNVATGHVNISGVSVDMSAGINCIVPKTTTAPSSVAGSIYFNTTTNHFMGYDGSSWKQLDN